MTDHLKQRHGKINDFSDLRRRIEFFNDKAHLKTGVEMEFHIQDLKRPNDTPSFATDERVLPLKEALRSKNIDVDDEIAAHMIEIKTEAYGLSALPDLIDRVKEVRKTLVEEAAKLDLRPSPFAVLADLDVKNALKNLIKPTAAQPERGSRPRAMMHTLQNLELAHLMPYPLLNSSVQASTGMNDPDHMFKTARRHYYLLPFYFVALNSRPPQFNKMTGEKSDTHSGIEMRRLLKDRGLIPDAFYKATDGESFLAHYFSDVFDRPMLCHADLQDQFHMATSYPGESIKSLRGQDMNTYSNFNLSESFDWFSGKRKIIPDTNLTRFESRDIDSGLHNDVSFTIISSLMTMDEECGCDIDNLLAAYGYSAIPAHSQAMLERDLSTVQHNARAYMDVPYGTGRMDEFAKDFYRTIEPHAHKHGVSRHLAALDLICNFAVPDAKMIDRICKTQQDVVNLQKSVSTEQQARGVSFGMLYDMGL